MSIHVSAPRSGADSSAGRQQIISLIPRFHLFRWEWGIACIVVRLFDLPRGKKFNPERGRFAAGRHSQARRLCLLDEDSAAARAGAQSEEVAVGAALLGFGELVTDAITEAERVVDIMPAGLGALRGEKRMAGRGSLPATRATVAQTAELGSTLLR